MRRTWLKRGVAVLSTGLLISGAVWFTWPRPSPVDLATVAKGGMEVMVEDEGKTRVRHIYTVSAPIAGKVLRTPRHVGDEVSADETVVAMMQATAPGFLDVRSREELQAALSAAESAVEFAEHEVHRIETALEFARSELQRARALARRDVIAEKALDKARVDVEANEHALASAKAQLEVRRSERAIIAARLTTPERNAAPTDSPWGIKLRAPVSGRVLTIHQESEAVVQAGTPLIDIGDPRDLEVVADLLSIDAVQIKIGASVRIDGWGGPMLNGRVRRIDPAGFTKVSALGIEEQRVRTTIDLVDEPQVWSTLGHDFRVIVHVIVWKSEDALTVPVAALFRRRNDWAVFTVRNGRARVTAVAIGHRTDRVAEVVSGLSLGDKVILYPSDRITEGAAVTEREKD